jgi:hypothetical protein
MPRPPRALLIFIPAIALAAAASRAPAAPSIQQIFWKKSTLDSQFRSEDAAVADVNRDGKPDVLAGNLWYEAPTWRSREIRPVEKYDGATGYSNCFLSFADDVDGDGWVDQIVVGFPGAPATWRKNPGTAGGNWAEFPITDSACSESPLYVDVDRDGRPELVTPYQEKQMAYYKPGPHPEKGWEQHLIGEPGKPGVQRFSHGLGAGDVNGDRRPDILCTEGWYEAPANPNAIPWKFVPAKLGPACAQMYTHDFDRDGDMDVFSSSAHQIGVWWWEQVKGASGPEFEQHVIDDTFSQSHSVMVTDVNGDRRPDFITGKRWWAHGPNGDVNPGDPAVLYWYEFKEKGGQVTWTRHEIDDNSGVGTGFKVADMNDDGLPDVVVSNKKGVFVLLQERGH